MAKLVQQETQESMENQELVALREYLVTLDLTD